VELSEKQRDGLLNLAAKRKAENNLAIVDQVKDHTAQQHCVQIATRDLPPAWLEKVDSVLWEEELLLIRGLEGIQDELQLARFTEIIAQHLQVCVVGNTVYDDSLLLYRPGIPAHIDL